MTEDQKENRIERRAICEAEKVPEEEIQAMFKKHPQIYGIADYTEKQDGLPEENLLVDRGGAS
jgi:hypothetical protein